MFFEPIILLVIPLLIYELNRLSYVWFILYLSESCFIFFKKLYVIRLDVLHDNDTGRQPICTPILRTQGSYGFNRTQRHHSVAIFWTMLTSGE